MGRSRSGWRLKQAAAATPVLLATLLLVSCGGGGGGESDAIPCTALNFDRALANLSNGDVYLDEATSTCSTLSVSVLVNNLAGIYTVGFDLSFPASLLSYDTYTLGPLMQKGSPANQVQVLINETSGSLGVSVTRLGSDPSVNANGSETLITFRFSRVAAGAAGMDFDVSGGSSNTELVKDENGATRPAIFAPGHGGMVIVP